MAKFLNLFETLGVRDTDTKAAVSASYEAKSLLAHPDHNALNKEEATALQQQLNAARDILLSDKRLAWMVDHAAELRKYFGRDDLCWDLPGANKRPRSDSNDGEGTTNANAPKPPFDPTGLHAGVIFEFANLKKGIAVGEVAEDPDPKRMVVAGFNKQCSIMRRAVPFDITGTRIDTTSTSYRDFRGATVKRPAIHYVANQGWETAQKAEEEGQLIFAGLMAEGFTSGWGYTSYQHMVGHKYLKSALKEATKRQVTRNYDLVKAYRHTKLSDAEIKTQAASTNQKLSMLWTNAATAVGVVGKVDGRAKAKVVGNNYLVALQKLHDGIGLEMATAMEEAVKQGDAGDDVDLA
ncbi:hypothetical protein MMC16_006624 [Acarospora aff. strigata]|nr:hypothetical protein [Acarospora aff. strigata]